MNEIQPDQLAAIDRLIALITIDAQGAATQRAAFKEALTEDHEQDFDQDDAPLWILNDVIDWDTGFFVDWKDTESFVDVVDQLAQARGVTIDWGVEDPLEDKFLNSTDVPTLMKLAYGQLAAQGWMLWNWDTESDCYCGWIVRGQDDSAMLAVADQLGVCFRKGDVPF